MILKFNSMNNTEILQDEEDNELFNQPIGTYLFDFIGLDKNEFFNELIESFERNNINYYFDDEKRLSVQGIPFDDTVSFSEILRKAKKGKNRENLLGLTDDMIKYNAMIFKPFKNKSFYSSMLTDLYYDFSFYEKYITSYINDPFYHDINFLDFLNDNKQMPIFNFKMKNEKVSEKRLTLDELKNYYKEIYQKNNGIYEYEIKFPGELLTRMLYYIVKNDYLIKNCANCNRYFIPFLRSDTLYCDRVSPQDKNKTCKEYGAERAYYNNLINNEALALCRKIYMQKQMLVKRNPDIETYKISFERYKSESKQWKADIKLGEKTEDDFLTWLKKQRKEG